MDFSILTTNWNNLPVEIKLIIIKNLENNSRLALRSCSIDDLKLVDSVPFRKLHWLKLECFNNIFRIIFEKNYDRLEEYQFNEFQEFQEKLLTVIENADYINTLDITMKNTVEKIKLKPKNREIEVKRLLLNVPRPEDCLQQVNASFLKKLSYESDSFPPLYDFHDIPQSLIQFNSVDEIEIHSYSIRDDQLMKIKSKKFTIMSSVKLTANGICEFIKERTSDPNFKSLSFKWLDDDLYKAVIEQLFRSRQQNCKTFIHPSFSEFETTIEGVNEISMRRIRINSTVPSDFKKVELVHIESKMFSDSYNLTIKETSDESTSWPFQPRKKIQEILTEKMKNIDYIKFLNVNIMSRSHCWRFVPKKSSKQITVGHLEVNCRNENGDLVVDLLKQIEPGHLKVVELYGENICNDVYDMQQVIKAKLIGSSHTNIQDHQLLKLSAARMSFNTPRNRITTYEKITASGANEFIKKCLLDLNKRNFDFELVLSYKCKYREFISTLLEGLDIFTMKNDQKILEEFYPSEVIVNSNWDNFKLKLIIDRHCLNGKRIEV